MKGWCERQRNILDVALASLLRRRGKNLSLLVVYSLTVFLGASVMFYSTGLKREARLLLSAAPELVVQRLSAGRHDLIPVAYAEGIRTIRGVGTVAPRLWGYYYDAVYGANYTVQVPTLPPPTGEIVIGPGIARLRKVATGDLLPFLSYRREDLLLQVREILPAESELVSTDLLLLAEADFRTLFAFPPGVATDLTVTVRNPQEVATVARKIVERFPDTRPILREEMQATYAAVFDWRGGLLLVLFGVVLLAFIIFAWDKAAGLSAEERREIGILKGIGWETGDILTLKFWEGTSISLTAFLLGTLLAYVHVFLFKAPLLAATLKGWAVLYPDFRLVSRIDAFQLTVLFVLTVIPYTVATLVPSWRAATIDPDSVMRD